MASFLKFLEDGGWHKLSELAKQTGCPLKKLGSYSQTLAKHGILEYDPATSTVRLSQELINLITQLRAEENAPTRWEKLGVATIIVPPEKGFQIQKVTIHNLTKQDLQFELKFNTKLKEIAITQA
jgi:hypothetical protein